MLHSIDRAEERQKIERNKEKGRLEVKMVFWIIKKKCLLFVRKKTTD